VDSRRGVLTGLQILVVDDDLDSREILKSLLGYFGALVTVAEGVGDAIRKLQILPPHVVIADMILGRRSSGFGLIAAARQQGSTIPFIAISGQDYDPKELERAGFAAYLRKPLDHNTVVDTVLAVVPRR
jgi:CheY-like chemotaxis protein